MGIDEFHTPSILVELFTSYLTELGYTIAINNLFSATLVPLHYYHKTTELKSIMIEVNRKLYLNGTHKNEHFTSIKSVITGLLNIVDHYESENTLVLNQKITIPIDAQIICCKRGFPV